MIKLLNENSVEFKLATIISVGFVAPLLNC